jgi:hypothetical protein
MCDDFIDDFDGLDAEDWIITGSFNEELSKAKGIKGR